MAGDDMRDLIVNTVGAIGRYQVMIVTLILISRISSCLHQVIIVLHAPPVGNFTCHDSNFTKCDPKCPSHEFDHSIWERTIVHEWDLVCDKHFYASMSQSIVMFGMLVGNVSFGFLSDRFGRRIPVAAGITAQAITGVLIALVPWFWLYTILRFLCSVATGGSILTIFCILVEFTIRQHRSLMAILFALPCQVSFAMMGLIGYNFRRWDYIQLIISAPSTLLISFWCLLPESPRWLLTMGKIETVIALLEKTARFNHKPTENIQNEVYEYLNNNPRQEIIGGNFFDLFNTRRMLTKTVVISFNWMVIGIVFFAIAQYMGQISGNIFLNITLAGLAQMPGLFAAYILLEKIGRKLCLITGFIFMTFPMVIVAIVTYQDLKWSIAMLGCFSISGGAMGFAVIMIYAGELYPTMIRSVGLGFSSMFGQYGSMIAPFILELQLVHVIIPPLLLAIFPIISALLTYFLLPDTNGVPLPNTVEDANKL